MALWVCNITTPMRMTTLLQKKKNHDIHQIQFYYLENINLYRSQYARQYHFLFYLDTIQ